jgi:hypothetical protein
VVQAANGFGPKFLNLICQLIVSSYTRILINGDLTDKILHRRGLRQGDRMLPLLFSIVMDCLVYCVDAAENVGLLKSIGRQGLKYRISLHQSRCQ